MADIQCVFESMTDKGSIYISNFAAASDLLLLQSKNIKAVLSAARSGLLHHRKEDISHYLYIPAQDHEDYELSKYFSETYEFIENARKETNVLVHCMVGVSRSVTIVIAYLLKKYKYTLGQVISLIQRKRRKINPNKGFIEQLKKYGQSQGIKNDFYASDVHHKENSAQKYKKSFSFNKYKYVQSERTSFYAKQENCFLSSSKNKQLKQITKQKEQKMLAGNVLAQKRQQFNEEKSIKKNQIQQQKTRKGSQSFAETEFEKIGEQSFLNLNKISSNNSRFSHFHQKISIEDKIQKVRNQINKGEQPRVTQYRRCDSFSLNSYLNKQNTQRSGNRQKQNKIKFLNKDLIESHQRLENQQKYEFKQKQPYSPPYNNLWKRQEASSMFLNSISESFYSPQIAPKIKKNKNGLFMGEVVETNFPK